MEQSFLYRKLFYLYSSMSIVRVESHLDYFVTGEISPTFILFSAYMTDFSFDYV